MDPSSSSSLSIAAATQETTKLWKEEELDISDNDKPESPQRQDTTQQQQQQPYTESSSSSLPHNLSCNGRWISFDDGHIPETTPSSTTQLAFYPGFVEQRQPRIVVCDDLVPPQIVQALYETTKSDHQPWGTYITKQQLQEYKQRKQPQPQHGESTEDREEETCKKEDIEAWRNELALKAAHAFFQVATSSPEQVTMSFSKPSPGSREDSREKDHSLWSDRDEPDWHGVAVWALGATVGSQVPYHLDYAEQVRYDTNRIVPPVLAGTLQCTPETVRGGEYWAHFDGLDHYQKYGYKGVKQQQQSQSQSQQSKDVARADMEQEPGWTKIPYRHNRMIVQSGHLPHLSTPIQSIGEEEPTNCKGDSTTTPDSRPAPPKRVIVGFNVFLSDVGPQVQRAPEHSSVFRRKVALQRWLMSTTTTASKEKGCKKNQNPPLNPLQQNQNDADAVPESREPDPSSTEGWNLDKVRANPSLAKFLVLAKRQKVKSDFSRRQQELEQGILLALQHTPVLLVSELIKGLSRSDGEYPSPTDVQVHLHHNRHAGVYEIVPDAEANQANHHNVKDVPSPNSHVRKLFKGH